MLARLFRGRRDNYGGGFERDEDFVRALYGIVLGREPDPEGLEFHLRRLREGQVQRRQMARDFLRSDECRYNCLVKYPAHKVLFDFVEVAETAPFLPYVQKSAFGGPPLCELTNPRKWLDPEWFAILEELQAISLFLDDMHRKFYEFAQTIYGLRKLSALGPETSILGVGAGHELLLYWLANQAKSVTATDLYEGQWSQANVKEGDPAVLDDPAKYAPFPYRADRLTFRRMDGRKLEFPDDSFDVVYSLSSIEHFGGHDGSARSMAEMGRILKPGGVAAVATEMIVNGRSHDEFFTPEDLLRYVVAPAGMPLVQAPEFRLPRHALDNPLRMPEERLHTPHLVLSQKGMLYTSVMLFFRKA